MATNAPIDPLTEFITIDSMTCSIGVTCGGTTVSTFSIKISGVLPSMLEFGDKTITVSRVPHINQPATFASSSLPD
jgi:hypothetical protein